jgi:hypothetical protein
MPCVEHSTVSEPGASCPVAEASGAWDSNSSSSDANKEEGMMSPTGVTSNRSSE